jgi:Domain of unknown function (DUF4336)
MPGQYSYPINLPTQWLGFGSKAIKLLPKSAVGAPWEKEVRGPFCGTFCGTFSAHTDLSCCMLRLNALMRHLESLRVLQCITMYAQVSICSDYGVIVFLKHCDVMSLH